MHLIFMFIVILIVWKDLITESTTSKSYSAIPKYLMLHILDGDAPKSPDTLLALFIKLY